MHEELEEQEEESYHQRAHQDVLEELGAGVCQTVKSCSLPDPARREAPLAKLVHTCLNKGHRLLSNKLGHSKKASLV